MMRKLLLTGIIISMIFEMVDAQQGFFLDNWVPKTMVTPSYTDLIPVNQPADVSVTIHADDTLTKVPVYMFGDNVNAYTSSMSENKTLMGYLSDRKMGVLRGPSGSISDVYFWNRSEQQPPADVPNTLMSGGDNPGWAWYGKRPNPWDAGWTMDIDSFYRILAQTGVTGMITVNYGYARYGTSDDPVAQAAHLAADWVRYDNGRTKFWEIGNEVFGGWEAGYKINTALNKDGQPEYINGTLYGKHCKVFIDSMKSAAAETGSEIYIGAVAAEGSGSGPANWNVNLMKETGNAIDFYIIHNYFTPWNQNSNADVILKTPVNINACMNYLKTCANQAAMPMKPVALTEYNVFAVGSKQMVSQIGGMFAVMVTGEATKAGVGAACRWDLANGYNNGDDHGMFSYGDEPGVTKFSPRPAFYYLYYMQKYLGDVMLNSTSKGSSDIKAYSGSFASGHYSTILANTGLNNRRVRINIENGKVGNRYYTFTLVGGTDVPADPLKPFSRKVYVNGEGPSGVAGGPLNYKNIKAKSGLIGNEILIEMPPFSVAFVVTDTGNSVLVKNDTIYPAVTWNNPGEIVYGTQLSAVQLNATANMSGNFIYDPASGTGLNAGDSIILKVTFTPDDNTYSPVTKTVIINVRKATPMVQWANPEDIPLGTELDDNQLNATSNTDGIFRYEPPAGTVLDIGTGQVLSVTFVPSDTMNYDSVSKSVQVNVISVTDIIENNAASFEIHPVPVDDYIILSGIPENTGNTIRLRITGIDGGTIYRTLTLNEGNSIHVADLPAGLYVLQLFLDGKQLTKRFVKK